MARLRPEVTLFREDHVEGVVALMEELAPRVGWLTLQPGFDEDLLPDGRQAARLLARRPPLVPICNWIPGERSRNGIEHVALGIEHGKGKGAVTEVPEGWEIMFDHPRNGLIVAAPPATPNADVLRWLLATGRDLSKLELSGEWRALAFRRKRRATAG